ncbi:MAG: hemerythrin family protein [Betaproteobacteria bacterium]|nr:hemerythrin family protein [Betaproteobacteria bacterium]
MEEVPWLITWNETLSLGIPEVDEDHRRFISLLNELNRAILACRDKTEIRQRLDAMVADARKHFEHEERLLAENGYPDAARHARVHGELMDRIAAAMVYFNSAGFSQVWVEKGLLIKNLLVEHLLEEDMKYRDFLSSRMTRPNARDVASGEPSNRA